MILSYSIDEDKLHVECADGGKETKNDTVKFINNFNDELISGVIDVTENLNIMAYGFNMIAVNGVKTLSLTLNCIPMFMVIDEPESLVELTVDRVDYIDSWLDKFTNLRDLTIRYGNNIELIDHVNSGRLDYLRIGPNEYTRVNYYMNAIENEIENENSFLFNLPGPLIDGFERVLIREIEE